MYVRVSLNRKESQACKKIGPEEPAKMVFELHRSQDFVL